MRLWTKVALGSIASLSLLAFPAVGLANSGSGSTPTLTPVADAVQLAASLPQPQSLAAVNQQEMLLTPAVDAVIARGNSAIDQLLITAGPTSPAIEGLLLAKVPLTVQGASAPGNSAGAQTARSAGVRARHGARPRAHTASCWGNGGQVWSAVNLDLAGAWVATLQVNSGGWCGNGSTITSYANGLDYSRTFTGFCFANESFDPWSWTNNPSEAEMYVSGQAGFNYALGCISGGSTHGASIYVHGSGAWQGYNW
jgi:hypothetical protein